MRSIALVVVVIFALGPGVAVCVMIRSKGWILWTVQRPDRGVSIYIYRQESCQSPPKGLLPRLHHTVSIFSHHYPQPVRVETRHGQSPSEAYRGSPDVRRGKQNDGYTDAAIKQDIVIAHR